MDILVLQEKKKIKTGEKYPVPEGLRHFIAEFGWIATGDVDVDASLLVYNGTGKLLETISFTHPLSEDGSINHHGDMSSRLKDEESRREFERIEIRLDEMNENLHSVLFVASCHKGSFGKVSLLELKIIQVEKQRVDTKERTFLVGRVDKSFVGEGSKWTSTVFGDLTKVAAPNTGLEDKGEGGNDQERSKWELTLGLPVKGGKNEEEGDDCSESVSAAEAAAAEAAGGLVVGYANNPDQAVAYARQHLAVARPHLVPRSKGTAYFVNRVHDVALKLGPKDLDALAPRFGEDGLAPGPFVAVLLQYFCKRFPQCRQPEHATHLVALLQDLFGQIDVQGDGIIEFDEFTDFCVNASNVHTGGELPKCQADEEVDFAPDPDFAQSKSRARVTRVRSAHGDGRFLLVREGATQVQLGEGRAGGRVALTLDCQTRLCRAGRAPVRAVADRRDVTDAVALDAAFLPQRKAIAITSTDHNISIWSYSPVGKGHSVASHLFSLLARSVQTTIHWIPNKEFQGKKGQIPGHLLSVGVDNLVSIWELESRAIVQQLRDHPSLVNDAIYNARHDLIITAGFDRKVRVFEKVKRSTMYQLACVFSEPHPIKLVDCDANTLCAVNTDRGASVFSLTLRKPTCRLVGHTDTIIGVKIASFIDGNLGIQTRAVTFDASGELRIWNLSSYNNREGTAEAFFIQQALPKGSYSTCSVMSTEYRNGVEAIWPDVVVAGVGFPLGCVRSIRRAVVQHEATSLIFNATAEAIIGAVGHKVMVWDANTSRKTKVYATASEADITAIDLDRRTQRTLFAGSMKGDVLLFNYVTGGLLRSARVHEGAVAAVRFCPASGTVASVGADRWLCVLRADAPSRPLALRTVQDAHGDQAILGMDYSPQYDLLASFGRSRVRLWTHEAVLLRGDIESCFEGELVAVLFIPGYPLLLASDTAGALHVIIISGVACCSVVRLVEPNGSTGGGEENYQDNPANHERASEVSQLNSDLFFTCLSTIDELVDTDNDNANEGANGGDAGESCPTLRARSVVAGDSKGFMYLWPVKEILEAIEKEGVKVIPYKEEKRGGSDGSAVQVCHRKGNVNLPKDPNFLDEAPPKSRFVPAELKWRAHNDSVTTISAMATVGLVVSASSAGKVKMWTAYGCTLQFEEAEPGAHLGAIGLADKESRRLEREARWQCPPMAARRHRADDTQRRARAARGVAAAEAELRAEVARRQKGKEELRGTLRRPLPGGEAAGAEGAAAAAAARGPGPPGEEAGGGGGGARKRGGEGEEEEGGAPPVGFPELPRDGLLALRPEDFPKVQKMLRKQRKGLCSSQIAKDYHGKILYQNMYSQLKAGNAGAAATAGDRARGRRGGGAGSSHPRRVDLTPSDFLREKLPDIHSPIRLSPSSRAAAAARRRAAAEADEKQPGRQQRGMAGSRSAPNLPTATRIRRSESEHETGYSYEISADVEVKEESFFVTQQDGSDLSHRERKKLELQQKMEATLKSLDNFLEKEDWGREPKTGIFDEDDGDTVGTMMPTLDKDRMQKLQEKFDRSIKTPMDAEGEKRPLLAGDPRARRRRRPRPTLIQRQQRAARGEGGGRRRRRGSAAAAAAEGNGGRGEKSERSKWGGHNTYKQILNIAKVFHHMDKSGDNLVSYIEFEKFLATGSEEAQVFQGIHFSMLDTDNSGEIEITEIIEMLFNHVSSSQRNEISNIILKEMEKLRHLEQRHIRARHHREITGTTPGKSFEEDSANPEGAVDDVDG